MGFWSVGVLMYIQTFTVVKFWERCYSVTSTSECYLTKKFCFLICFIMKLNRLKSFAVNKSECLELYDKANLILDILKLNQN